jgi:hexosaminidase
MEGWMDSKVATFPLLKLGLRPERVILETKPHPKYSGKMDSTLVDGKSASPDRSDKEYLGFINNDCQVLFQFHDPEKLSQLTLSFLEDVGQGVLAPESVEVWGGEDKNNLTKLGRVVTVPPQKETPAAKCIIKINFPPQSLRFVRLTAKNVKTLPAWHEDKKTTKPSIFIDEVALE